MRPCDLRVLGAAVVALAIGWPAPAAAYEFEVNARTIGQGYTLTSLRPLSGDLALSRRRLPRPVFGATSSSDPLYAAITPSPVN